MINTNPSEGYIRIYGSNNLIALEGEAPLQGMIEPDFYKIIADKDQIKVEREVMISASGQSIVINLFDPIHLIILNYKNENFQRVIDIFEDPSAKQNILQEHSKYCEALGCVYISYFKLNLKNKAYDNGKLLYETECRGNDSYFFKNLAMIAYELNKWEEADEFFKKARMYIVGVASEERPEFNADCFYFRAIVRLEIIKQDNFIDAREKCQYINRTITFVKEFIDIAMDKGFSMKNAGALNSELEMLKINNGCQ